ncbi:uncharacterized protein [Primulina eburnea]|uniref:uncharacterized protein isoform X2 n=1 Tax=Primulina eburnea TaxID=1245227 RepID=UPI003C6C3AE1
MFIVLIKSLSAVARKRPAFYGRILPVLLGLDPSVSASENFHISGSRHALKNAFECCLNCTHPGAVPLPPAQLENALNRTPALRSPLVAHANQPHIRSSLPRSSLVVLGIVSDAQTSNQPKPTQSPTGENGNSDKGAVTE